MAGKDLNGRIVFLDSGAGGLPYLGAYRALDPERPLLYVADKKNFPYGEKTKAGLVSLLLELTARVQKHFSPALIVIACNTASVSALAELRQCFPGTDFVGTVPAVKPALLSSAKKHIAILGTKRTLQDRYINGIAESTANDCTVTRISAAELVDFVEYRLDHAGRGERMAAAKKYMDAVRECGADALVLGCTHFLFLLDEFREAAGPGIRVFDSIDGVCHRVESILAQGSRAGSDSALRSSAKTRPGGGLGGSPQPCAGVGGRDGEAAVCRRRYGNSAPLMEEAEKESLPDSAGRRSNLLLVTGDEGGGELWERRAACFDLSFVKPQGWDDV
ncbi:MAG: glutamate racemase [Spirochaetaceae bacterium]|nr:glutamate racemase [Spirochaetaceae bacterium]